MDCWHHEIRRASMDLRAGADEREIASRLEFRFQ
jgi:hypothetical protein